jgi:hypothetical protein
MGGIRGIEQSRGVAPPGTDPPGLSVIIEGRAACIEVSMFNSTDHDIRATLSFAPVPPTQPSSSESLGPQTFSVAPISFPDNLIPAFVSWPLTPGVYDVFLESPDRVTYMVGSGVVVAESSPGAVGGGEGGLRGPIWRDTTAI